MDIRELNDRIVEFNKVKDLILSKLVEEGTIDHSDADEFSQRCHVIIYRGTWFSRWFKNTFKKDNPDESSYYIRIVELNKKEDEVDRLIRRTTGDYDE